MSLATPPKNKRRIDCNLIPSAMRELPHWIAALGAHDKAPRRIHPRLGRASSTDPASWSPFDLARKFCEERDLAITFALPLDGSIVAIDLDGAVDAGGEPFDWAREVLAAAAAARCYLERSISGAGFHVFGRAPRGWNGPNRIPLGESPAGGKSPAIEVFDRGRVIVLGEPLAESVPELGDLSPVLERIRERFLAKTEPKLKPKPAAIPRGERGSSPHRRVTARELRERLGAPASGPVRCPSHDDRNPSCSIDDSPDGSRTLVHCFAGCSPESIAAAAGLTIGDLFEEPPRSAARLPRGGVAGGEASEGAAPPVDPRGRVTVAVPKMIGSEDLIAREVLEALAGDPDVFVGPSGRLVEVIERFDPNQTPRLEIVPLSLAMVRELISRRVRFINLGDRGERSIPRFLPSAIADRNTWPGIRQLAGISRVPILRADGSLSVASGFDAESGVLIRPLPGASPLEVPESPTRDDGLRAIGELVDVVREFDFVEPSDRDAWLAFVLTLVGRRAIDGPSPMFVFDSPDQRSGKTLLLKIAGIIALGEQPALRTNADSTEEQRKAILAALLGAERLVALENVTTELGGAVLAGVITAERWCDRILGSSRTVEVSTKGLTIAASGNGVEIDSDLSRRVIFSRLRPHLEDKRFERDFPAWVFGNRDSLLRAALVALRAFIAAGRPGARDFVPLASFEAWSRLVAGALRWYGLTDPSEATRRIARARDSERVRSEVLLSAIEDFGTPGGAGVMVADLARAIETGSESESIRALAEFFGDPPNRSSLGRAIAKLVDSRKFGSRRLVRETARGGVFRYRVVRIGEGGLEREETDDA